MGNATNDALSLSTFHILAGVVPRVIRLRIYPKIDVNTLLETTDAITFGSSLFKGVPKIPNI